MAEPLWLRKELVLALHRRLLVEHGGAEGLRCEGLLESALARPRQRYSYEEADLVTLAATYGFGLIKNHAFVDGNKRIAAMATIFFLEWNGHAFTAPEAEVAAVFDSLAAGKMTESALAEWLRRSSPE